MEEVDDVFIKSLFPRYLLEQPLGHDLWTIYYENRKLFHKLKNKGDAISNVGDGKTRKFNHELSYETRKEIWEKLVSLGVLGTIPYDSANDDYLVQVYRYFYPNLDEDLTSTHLSIEKDTHLRAISDSEDLTKPIDPELRSVIQMEDDHDDEEEDVGDDDGDDGDDGDDHADENEEDAILNENQEMEDGSSSNEEQGSRSPNEGAQFYPALAESSHSLKEKPNPISSDIYKYLGYPLPHAWLSQPSNSILVSSDGCTQLRPNPTWQTMTSYDRASPVIGSGLRTTLSNQKFDYATTWANNPILHKNIAIFYYEIRMLSVTSSQSGQNCNVVVGFKDYSKLQTSTASSSRTDLHGDVNAINRQSASILRSTLDSSSSAGSSSGNNQSSRGNGFDKGSFGYCGTDGYITDGTHYKSFGKQYGRDDVIGCGVNYVDGTIFFTKNGVNLGTAFTDVHDIDLVPHIALRPGNSVRTNFGLHEEFLYDIIGYQNTFKAKAYQHIFKSIEGHDGYNDFDTNDTEEDEDLDDGSLDRSEDSESFRDGFLLPSDRRFSGDRLYKPDVESINNLNTDDDSIPCTMNAMINDYLIHDGLIDVAKGFLKDLQKDCIPDSDEERAKIVIRHNERQIIKEENNLRVRQDIRRLINEGNITQCLQYINSQFPGLLEENIDVLFELKVAEYLLTIVNFQKYSIDYILQKGQLLSAEFVYNPQVPEEMKERFHSHLSEISALLAYDSPLEECNEDLAVFLTPSYLQDRLFQLVNSRVLTFLKKKSESSLENMVSYTRAMVKALMQYGENSSVVHNDSELRYYKLVNIDEDLLNL